MTNYEQFEHGYKGLFDTSFLDLVPSDNSIDMQCTSYAIYRSMQVIRSFSERLCLFANIDSFPEIILDYLAMEWRLPYYDSEFSIEVKRKLVQYGFQWNLIAGTVEGIEDLIQAIYQSGTVVEWFDFPEEEQEPGLFDINIEGDIISPDSVNEFNRILRKVKRLSNHLRKVVANYDASHTVHIVTRGVLSDAIIINNKEGD